MKTVKLNKNMLALHPAKLLEKLGAINVEQNRVYPNHIYLSKEDYKTLSTNLTKKAQKTLKGYSKKYIDRSVSMELLNYGPNESLGDAIKKGFALIDLEGIEKEIQLLGN